MFYYVYSGNTIYRNGGFAIRENTYNTSLLLQFTGWYTGSTGGTANTYGISKFYDDGFDFSSGNVDNIIRGTYTWIAFE